MIDIFIPTNRADNELLERAVNTANDGTCKVYIVTDAETYSKLSEHIKNTTTLIESEDPNSVAVQFSKAVSSGDNDWAMILEHDDELVNIDPQEVLVQALSEYPSLDILLPLPKRTIKGVGFAGFGNSFLWNSLFCETSDEGRVTKKSLELLSDMPKMLPNLHFSGAIFKKGALSFTEAKFGVGAKALVDAILKGKEVRVSPKSYYEHNEGLPNAYSTLNVMGDSIYDEFSSYIKKRNG